MILVGILRCAGDDEWRAQVIGAVTGVSLPDARRRARPPGPKLVAVTPTLARAETVAAALEREGLAPTVLDVERIRQPRSWLVARSFEVRERTLEAATADLQGWSSPFGRIAAIVCGTRFEAQTRVTASFDRKVPLGGGLAGIPGALPREHQHISFVSRRLLHVFAHDGPTLVLDEGRLSYQGLGDARGQSHTINFDRLVTRLREAMPDVPYDDRLVTADGQAHLAAGVFDPQRILGLATTLVRRAIAPSTSPYR